jgi:Zn-finger nucleic acid-binding protein
MQATSLNPAICPHCTQTMRAVQTSAHYGKALELDVCERCHLIWFDDTESVRLSGLGLLAVLEQMARVQTIPITSQLAGSLVCPACKSELKQVANIVRHGRIAHYECPQQHGSLQNFALFLAERGLVRPLLPADLPRDASSEPLECLNCGAPVPFGAHQECAHCESPLCRIDIDRVAQLIAHSQGQQLDEVKQNVDLVDSSCGSCGTAVDKSRHMRCSHCHGLLATTHLRKAIETLRARLQQARRRKPGPARFEMPNNMSADEARIWYGLDGGPDWRGWKNLGDILQQKNWGKRTHAEVQLLGWVYERLTSTQRKALGVGAVLIIFLLFFYR